MSVTPQDRSARRPLDSAAVEHVQRRLNRAVSPPWLHTEVARRMAQRLPLIRLRPQQAVHWAAFLGGAPTELRHTYPGVKILAVESDAQRHADSLQQGLAPWWSPARWRGDGLRPVLQAELPAGQAQLVWANMALHAVIDPQQTMRAWLRALQVDGFVMCSTLGPGTLQDLSRIYAEAGWPPPMAPLVDMHDLGDMMIEAGFADPVMDQELLTLTWPSAQAALAELRQIGGNVDPRRFSGLRTPRWQQRLCDRLSARADGQGRIALHFELIYGHAFKPAPRPRVADETTVSLEDMRTMVQAGRGRG